MPAVATLHTVLPRPDTRPASRPLGARRPHRGHRRHVAIRGGAADQRLRCRRAVAWTSSRTACRTFRFVDPAEVKPRLGVEGRDVILSFGLLGPGKGYELALDALPDGRRGAPPALYVVVGATHPDLLRTEGEAYRETLVRQVQRLGMQNHVQFVDRFVGRDELTRWLQAADVFVTPYPEPRPDRVRDDVLCDGRGPRRSSRRRTPTPRSCWPTVGASSCRPAPRRPWRPP